MTSLNFDSLRARVEAAGQGHVFRFLDELDASGRYRLFAQLEAIDLEELGNLHETLVKGRGDVSKIDFGALEPAPYIAHPENGGDSRDWQVARQRGEAALREGKVAAFTVAGGQGTRLGFDGPKGTFPVLPLSGGTLFEVFAAKIAAAGSDYGVVIPWLVMTSPINHEATLSFFQKHDWFGLGEENVLLFQQGTMPAIDLEGKLFLAEKDSLALSPDGHGGSLRALVRSGAIEYLKERGITVLSYFQVDNPLVKVIDPAFIGFHLEAGSEMSSKMIPKAFPTEKVGNFCLNKGKTCVVEYSDLPEALAESRNADGSLRFVAGSIAIHILDVGFVERMGSARFPMHRADKKIAHVDSSGVIVKPESPNGVKFEMFVFDALPMAENPIVVETLRRDDFSPVKNAEGIDSPQTCREDQLREWASWARAAGIGIETDGSGLPAITFEVQPSYAYDCESFKARAKAEGLKTVEEGKIYK